MGKLCRLRHLLETAPEVPEGCQSRHGITCSLLSSRTARRAGAACHPPPPPPTPRCESLTHLNFSTAIIDHSFLGSHLRLGVQQGHIKFLLENFSCREGGWEKPSE